MSVAPQNIMSQLRFMEDADLAKFANLHQNDPFLFPLAFQESQDRKKLRAAQQAHGGQEQPKVVAQALQQMAPQQPQPQAQVMPEDVGIAKLEAPNMENFADGGIVAFDEGGEVPRFNGMYGSVPTERVSPRPLQRMPGDPLATQWDSMYGATHNPDGSPKMAPQFVRDPATKTYVPNPVREYQDLAAFDKAGAAYMDERAARGTSPRIEKEAGVVDKAIEQKRKEDEAAATGRTLPAEPGLPSLNAAMKQYEGTVYKNAPDKETLQKEFADIDKPLLAKMQANIDKEASRLKSDKDQDFYMSLIQGGLAAAAESGPNALQNVAKGFAVGAGNYAGALKDFRKATQENAKAEMELARYEATGKKDALKAYNEQIAKRDDRYAQGVAGIVQQNMASSATLGAAKLNRDAMGDYRDQAQVETIRKKVVDEVMGDVRLKNNAALREAEIERRLQRELQRYPNLAQYAGTPTTGGASGASTQGWGKATVIQPQR